MLLAGCVSETSWEAVRLLEDIEAGGAPSELKATTPAPSRRLHRFAVAGRERVADLYRPNQPVGAGIVLVPGFTPHGKNDRRVVELATSLARARFLVLVPDLAGARELRVRLEDAETIADSVVGLSRTAPHPESLGVVAISYAVGLAVLASQEPEVEQRLDFLVGIGSYFDTTTLVAFMTTGHFSDSATGARRWIQPNPAAKWIFLASNIDVLDDTRDQEVLRAIAERRLADPDAPVDDLAAGLGPEGRALYTLMTNEDPDRTAALRAALPQDVDSQIQALSLEGRDLSRLTGKLILVHGREDNLIPYSESQRLAAAVPDSELFVIDGFSHIDPSGVGPLGQLQLIDAVAAVLKRRQ